jgi:hypothetical protein
MPGVKVTYEPIGVFIGPLRPLFGEVEQIRQWAPVGLIDEMLAGDGPCVWQADRSVETPA